MLGNQAVIIKEKVWNNGFCVLFSTNINAKFVSIIPYVMKRIATLFALITMSVIMNAQTRGDFFAFVDSYNWKLSKEQFEKKYASRILPKTDSLVASMSFECPYYVLDDLSIGEYDCTTVVIFSDESSSAMITAVIPERITKQHMQSILATRLDNIAFKKMEMPDVSMDDVDCSKLGFDWLAGTTGDVKGWTKDKFLMFSFKAYTESGLLYSFVAKESEPSLMTENKPIQDTFFGLKMTASITSAQIKSAIGARGVFIEETRESNSINNLYKDVYFAGSKWDFANFTCTTDGKFYLFNAYNSFSDYDIDLEKEAKSQYEILKNKLDEKYGEGNEQKEDEENFHTIYFGSNDMSIIISYERSRSVGGSYRRYLKIEYINVTLFNNQISANDDEL